MVTDSPTDNLAHRTTDELAYMYIDAESGEWSPQSPDTEYVEVHIYGMVIHMILCKKLVNL